MGIQDFVAIFNNLDTACKGFVTDDQLLQLHQQIHLVPIALEHVQAAISQVCHVPGQVHRNEFLEVLEEIERRRSTEETAFWDFQALDYNNTHRISLKDALLLFKEFHGDRFSMYTWRQFLESRINPAADVCFDEIRLWLCDYPQGEPATMEQIIQEEERIDGKQRKFKEDEINSYKTLEDSQLEMQEYHDNTQRNAWRKLNKWKKQGVESMLFDDGLEPDDAEAPSRPTNQLTLNNVMEMLDTKYDLLREKLLMEMARMVSTLEGDQAEMYEQLCKQERQLRRQGNFEMEVSSLPGSDLPAERNSPFSDGGDS
ncbi:hypothetical protein FSP39_014083 [Pinctada imbricata]|uniref:EF-hand domain-containing protein n=1 Tax=Pinctada imbricata TaxID=66713 RepID=A0AA89CAT0_PINIB|nr:hypothetical protein FSP39_014083 [Pinctada imbricata]